MSRIATRRALLYRPPAAATSSNWWEVAGQTPTFVYKPKGAANLAASYINLVTGLTAAVSGWSGPTFNTALGWVGNTGSNCVFIDSGTSATVQWTEATTLVVRAVAVHSSQVVFWNVGSMAIYTTETGIVFAHGTTTTVTHTLGNDDVYAIAGNTCYINGSSVGSLTVAPHTNTTWIKVTPNSTVTTSVSALAIYSTTLSVSDVASLTTRMQAI